MGETTGARDETMIGKPEGTQGGVGSQARPHTAWHYNHTKANILKRSLSPLFLNAKEMISWFFKSISPVINVENGLICHLNGKNSLCGVVEVLTGVFQNKVLRLMRLSVLS